MNGALAQVLQVVGALLILAAYALAQARRLSDDSVAYLVMNLVGGGILAVLAGVDREWGFLLLEGSWALISLRGLARVDQRGASDIPRFGLVEYPGADLPPDLPDLPELPREESR